MRRLYNALISYEFRFLLYKLRNFRSARSWRSVVYSSPKGDFSLRAFDKYKCVFIHITKSAGTSVAKSLFNELPNHYTAIEYRVIFGRRDFNRYFKFAFVRNPWDRLYSAYTYLKDGGWNEQDGEWFSANLAHLPDFNTFVLEWLEPDRLNTHPHFYPQSNFICDSRGYPLLNYLGYFETMKDDFSYITQQLAIESTLIHVNATRRAGYKEIYSPEAISKVHSIYHQDIENFGYDFDGIKTRMFVQNRMFVAKEERLG